MQSCEVQIGDGSLFRDQEPHIKSMDDIPYMATATADITQLRVMWFDGEMFVKFSAVTREVDEEAPQPKVTLYFHIHDWEAMTAVAKSKRRDLELRSYHNDSDDTASV